MRISWTEKKSNGEVMEMAGYERSLLKTIRKIQLYWGGGGDINRAGGFEKQILNEKHYWYQEKRNTRHKM